MKRAAFTLVEVAAAIAIGALVMCAALGVVSHLWRAQAADGQQEPSELVTDRIHAMMSADWCHAITYRPVKDGIELRTLSRLDPQTMRLEHLPSIVTYRVSQIADRPWLVRTQAAENQTQTVTQLVSLGVTGMQLTGGDSAGGPQQKPVPQRLALTLLLEGGKKSEFELTQGRRW